MGPGEYVVYSPCTRSMHREDIWYMWFSIWSEYIMIKAGLKRLNDHCPYRRTYHLDLKKNVTVINRM